MAAIPNSTRSPVCGQGGCSSGPQTQIAALSTHGGEIAPTGRARGLVRVLDVRRPAQTPQST